MKCSVAPLSLWCPKEKGVLYVRYPHCHKWRVNKDRHASRCAKKSRGVSTKTEREKKNGAQCVEDAKRGAARDPPVFIGCESQKKGVRSFQVTNVAQSMASVEEK